MLFALFNRILGPFPGEYPAGVAVDVLISQLDRPGRTIVTSGTFDETAINHDGFLFVSAKQLRELLLGLPSGLLWKSV